MTSTIQSPPPVEAAPFVDRRLVEQLRAAVRLGDSQSVTAKIRGELERILGRRELFLPDGFRQPVDGTYARRLYHRDDELDWTAVVMTWAPGQKTPLHDHDGCWCVEGVVEGEIEVTLYERMDDLDDARVRFERRRTLAAAPGEAGALIPPYEYHVLGNPSSDRVALTLHVYQGRMARCSVFEPLGDAGLFGRRTKLLGYHE